MSHNLVLAENQIDIVESLIAMGVIPEANTTDSTRVTNVGASNYADKMIQPWSIWIDYGLNPWDADIVKRVLREKTTDSRELDYRKIIHICQERLRQLSHGV